MDIKNISGKGYTCQTVCPKIAVFCIKNGQIHTSGFTLANCDYNRISKEFSKLIFTELLGGICNFET
jgi:hypothetical protein